MTGRSPRGAWIEILLDGSHVLRQSLPTRGRGLKIATAVMTEIGTKGRSPRGGRGLKFCWMALMSYLTKSLPTRGAWIEIATTVMTEIGTKGRSPRGGRGLKSKSMTPSRPSKAVAPHAGGVD